jgi:anaerobic ribonucleoside-triphosphate reductase
MKNIKIKGVIMEVKEISKEEVLEKMKDKRQKCMVYTRVMGYHRPVESFNIGKKSEHKERKYFKEC